MMTLTESYLVTTYLVLGLAVAFDRIAESETGEPSLPLSGRLFVRMIGLSCYS